MVSPFEAMWGQKPNLHNLCLFGCKSQVYILDTVWEKLESKTKDCIFLGYTGGEKTKVFNYMAIKKWFVLQDVMVESMRLDLELVVGSFFGYQSKKQYH